MVRMLVCDVRVTAFVTTLLVCLVFDRSYAEGADFWRIFRTIREMLKDEQVREHALKFSVDVIDRGYDSVLGVFIQSMNSIKRAPQRTPDGDAICVNAFEDTASSRRGEHANVKTHTSSSTAQEVKEKPSPPKSFLCTSNPTLYNDAAEFYKMIWTRGVEAIIVTHELKRANDVTQWWRLSRYFSDDNTIFEYYPPSTKLRGRLYGDYVVRNFGEKIQQIETQWLASLSEWTHPNLKLSAEMISIPVTTLQISDAKNPQDYRIIKRFLIPNWVIESVPINAMAPFLVSDLTRDYTNVIVQRSSGAGTYMALDFALHSLLSGHINIESILLAPSPPKQSSGIGIRNNLGEVAVDTPEKWMYVHYALLKLFHLSGVFEKLSESQMQLFYKFEMGYLCRVQHNAYILYYSQLAGKRLPSLGEVLTHCSSPMIKNFLNWTETFCPRTAAKVQQDEEKAASAAAFRNFVPYTPKAVEQNNTRSTTENVLNVQTY